MKYVITLMMILLILSVAGCLHRTEIVKHPDAPMLVEQVGWRGVKVAIYDKENNQLIEYGWVKVPVGWTIHKYDWEAFLNR